MIQIWHKGAPEKRQGAGSREQGEKKFWVSCDQHPDSPARGRSISVFFCIGNVDKFPLSTSFPLRPAPCPPASYSPALPVGQFKKEIG
jgi:hypothetical protein